MSERRLLVFVHAAGAAALALGERLAQDGRARAVAVYLPTPELAGLRRHGLPEARSFDALVDIAGDGEDAAPALRALAGAAPPPHSAYVVDERRLAGHPRIANGQPTPGLVVVSPVFRAPALDAAAFDAHWRDGHGPIALARHAGMRDYRQAVVRERFGEGAPAFDGIARLGFPSAESYERHFFDSSEGRRALAEDTVRFVDTTRIEAALLRETVLK